MSDLQSLITQTLIQATLLAALVATATQATRKWVPRIDGWITVVVVAMLTVAVAYLFLAPVTGAEWIAAGRVALCTVIMALGGDALAAKMAAKARSATVVVEPDPAQNAQHVTITRGP